MIIKSYASNLQMEMISCECFNWEQLLFSESNFMGQLQMSSVHHREETVAL